MGSVGRARYGLGDCLTSTSAGLWREHQTRREPPRTSRCVVRECSRHRIAVRVRQCTRFLDRVDDVELIDRSGPSGIAVAHEDATPRPKVSEESMSCPSMDSVGRILIRRIGRSVGSSGRCRKIYGDSH